MKKISLRATALAVAALAAGQAWATNGMLMEGYGPIALSMGGAAQAYDNGTAAMMNNVATLQLGENGTRADMALGILGPNVTASVDKSNGTSYVMPAVGWVRKNDALSYGVGLFGQGGMGTEYGATSEMAAGTNLPVRSELGVGRLIFPVGYQVNSQLAVGASLDYSWAGLDLQMPASAAQLGAMYLAAGGTQQGAAGIASMVNSQGAAARISFSNGSDFTGAAKGSGWTGKFGLTFKASKDLTLGASYQLKTNLSDLETSGSGATMTLYTSGGPSPLTGKMIVKDFQMPSVLAFGGAFQATPSLMLVADIKKIGWKSVMNKFNMSFISSQMVGTFGTDTMNFAMDQQWRDQTVLSIGSSYKLNDALILRAGMSHSTNPIPDSTVHPLFPAIIKDHYTMGFGYQVDKKLSLDVAVSYAPKVTVNAAQLVGTTNDVITHSQTNYQLMLSYRY